MSHDFRSVLALQFQHAAALARALKTLKSYDVFGGVPVTEGNATDIGICFISEILQGHCPVLNPAIKTVEGLDHKRDQVTFLEGESACIEAFNVIIMDHSARITLRRAFDTFRLETNKDINGLLWNDDKATEFQLNRAAPKNKLIQRDDDCGCVNCGGTS